MQKYLMLPMLLLVCSCTDEQSAAVSSTLGYSLHPELQNWEPSGFSYHDASQFSSAGISIEDAQKWKKSGFNSDASKLWASKGYTSTQAREALEDGVKAPGDVTGWSNALAAILHEDSVPSALAISYANASAVSGFTRSDVQSVLAGTDLDVNDERSVIMAAEKFHKGISLTQIRTDIQAGRAAVAQAQAREAANAQAAELYRLNKAYGTDVINACHGSPENDLMTLQNITNPYSVAGKCFTIHIGWLSTPQWLNANQALFISNVPSLPTVLISGDEPLKVGAAAVVMGQTPQQYTSAIGALETPITVRVLKYFND
ncbi:hypothetical protein JK202_10935 [Gluconobacter sp. Dm-62]|uniref:hypothetical protein n=1 Tax=Gluconobacter sp. Dm-62 TaxID=2799804 RepID=UPI001B8CEDAB|nr:hypothetical protein [Gluconobacter sp. Dm-62]MBS1103523.1 hypothetical protein [Gluconobacter sp. Dm-62]